MSSFSIPPIKQSPLIGLEGLNGGAVSSQNLPAPVAFEKMDDYDNYRYTGDPIEVIGDWTQGDLASLPTDRLFYLTFDMYDSPTTTKTIAAVALVNSISGYSSQTNGKSGGDAFTYDGLPDGLYISLSILANGDAASKKTIALSGGVYNAQNDSVYAIDDNDCNVMNHKGDLVQCIEQRSFIPLHGSADNNGNASNFIVYRDGDYLQNNAAPDSANGLSNALGHPEVSANHQQPPMSAVYAPFPAVEKAIYGWSGKDANNGTLSYNEGYKITDATQVTGVNSFLKGIQNKYNESSDTAYWGAFNHTTTQLVANRSVIITDGIGSFIVGHAGFKGVVYHELNYKTGLLVNSRTFQLPYKMCNDQAPSFDASNNTEEDCFGDVLLTVNGTTCFGFSGEDGSGNKWQRLRFGGRDGWRHPERAWLQISATGTDSFRQSDQAASQAIRNNDQSGRDWIGMIYANGTVAMNTWGHDDQGIFGTSSSHNDSMMGFNNTTMKMLMRSNVTSGTINQTFYTDTSAYG